MKVERSERLTDEKTNCEFKCGVIVLRKRCGRRMKVGEQNSS